MRRHCCYEREKMTRKSLTSAVFALLSLALVLLPQSADALEPQRVVSPGGIEAWLIQDDSNPLLSLSFAFRTKRPADRDRHAPCHA